MIRFACPHCKRVISAGDEHAGKQAPCPGCKQPVTVPNGERAPQVSGPAERGITKQPRAGSNLSRAKSVPTATPSGGARPRPSAESKRSRRDEDDEVVDVEVIEDDDEVVDVEVIEEEEEEVRPRRRRKRSRTGPYATCPECGERGDARRVSYTLWGGFVGPWLLTHVRCNNCGAAYNGKTGNSNTTAIVLWVVIPLGIGIVGVVLGLIAEALYK
jgi:hypothetical protein